MANRFWVGGSGSWTGAATANWSATSGGAGGASAPTTSDDVVFDAASGAGVVTISGGATVCRSVTFVAGFTGTLAGSAAWTIAGHTAFTAGMTLTYTGTVTFTATSAATIAMAGKRLRAVVFNGAGGTWTCQDNFQWGPVGSFNLKDGTFDANDFNVDGTGSISFVVTGTAVLNMGNGTWTVNTNGNPPINFDGATVNPENSTLILTSAISGSSLVSFGTLHNVQLVLSGAGQLVLTSGGTFNDLRIGWPTGGGHFEGNIHAVTVNGTFTIDPGTDVRFGALSPSVFNGTFNGSGTSSLQNKISGPVSKSAGTISVAYATITNSDAAGGATWRAPRSQGNVDGGGNTGWLFDSNVQQIIQAQNA